MDSKKSHSYLIRVVDIFGEMSFFESAKDAAQGMKVDQTCISRALSGIQKTAGGLYFSQVPRVLLVKKWDGSLAIAKVEVERGKNPKWIDLRSGEEIKGFGFKLDISEPFYKNNGEMIFVA